METLETLNGQVITDKHGRQYSLVMGDMAVIQSRVPVKEEHRPFIALRDVMRFMASPQGVDIALQQAAVKHDPQASAALIASSLTVVERFGLVDQLLASFMGLDRTPTDPPAGEGGDQDQAPLADPNGTGG